MALERGFAPFLKNCMVRKYPKGSIIIYQGEVPRSAFFIKEGIIKAYGITSQGEEKIVTFHIKNEPFPTSWIFNKSSSAILYYEATSDCELYIASKEALLEYVDSTPAAKEALFNYYVTNFSGALLRILALEQNKAREKILYTLHHLTERYGREVTRGNYRIQIELTHQVIASLVGLTRETTAIELNKLRKRGVINYKGHTYEVKKADLIRIMGEDGCNDLTF